MPARALVVRRHVGLIIMQRFVKMQQPLCRECGRSATLRYTRRTLWQGWWGLISFFANFFVLLANATVWIRYSRLAPPSTTYDVAPSRVPFGLEADRLVTLAVSESDAGRLTPWSSTLPTTQSSAPVRSNL